MSSQTDEIEDFEISDEHYDIIETFINNEFKNDLENFYYGSERHMCMCRNIFKNKFKNADSHLEENAEEFYNNVKKLKKIS